MDDREANRRGWLLPTAAALLVAAAIGLWMRTGRITGNEPSRSSLSGGAGDWAIDKPAVTPPPAGPAINSDMEYSTTALTAALEPYRRDNFADAAISLEGFVATHPQSADGWFYLGASRLLSGDAARARAAFDKALVLSAAEQHPELEWLAATAEARTGAIEPARARLEALCASPNPVQVRACAAKESLKR
jgi:tetratricopeptide (TPR) repeat protein